jgi:hypothetical protein
MAHDLRTAEARNPNVALLSLVCTFRQLWDPAVPGQSAGSERGSQRGNQ